MDDPHLGKCADAGNAQPGPIDYRPGELIINPLLGEISVVVAAALPLPLLVV